MEQFWLFYGLKKSRNAMNLLFIIDIVSLIVNFQKNNNWNFNTPVSYIFTVAIYNLLESNSIFALSCV